LANQVVNKNMNVSNVLMSSIHKGVLLKIFVFAFLPLIFIVIRYFSVLNKIKEG